MVYSLSVGAFESNCYLLANEQKEAILIDPGADADRILALIEQHGLRVAVILLTHGHMDHVSALAEVQRRHPALVAMHPLDASWAFTEKNAMPPYFDAPEAPPAIERELADGQTWTDAGYRYKTLTTPGHSPGSVSFYFEDEGLLFSGDVLFQGSAGRTDLPGGSSKILTESLNRLALLPDETIVYPGHGPETTIGVEKKTNYYMLHGMP